MIRRQGPRTERNSESPAPSLSDDRDGDGALPGPDVAFEQEHLLPGAQHQPSVRDRHGQAGAKQGGLEVRVAVAVVPRRSWP